MLPPATIIIAPSQEYHMCVDDKNRNEDFACKVLLKAYYYKLTIYIILVGGTPL
jgi:hypothetical protein